MAKVTETRVKITLTDAMSGPLRKIEGEANSTNKAVGNLAGSLKSFTAVGAQIAAGAFGFTALSDSIYAGSGQLLDFFNLHACTEAGA